MTTSRFCANAGASRAIKLIATGSDRIRWPFSHSVADYIRLVAVARAPDWWALRLPKAAGIRDRIRQ